MATIMKLLLGLALLGCSLNLAHALKIEAAYEPLPESEGFSDEADFSDWGGDDWDENDVYSMEDYDGSDGSVWDDDNGFDSSSWEDGSGFDSSSWEYGSGSDSSSWEDGSGSHGSFSKDDYSYGTNLYLEKEGKTHMTEEPFDEPPTPKAEGPGYNFESKIMAEISKRRKQQAAISVWLEKNQEKIVALINKSHPQLESLPLPDYVENSNCSSKRQQFIKKVISKAKALEPSGIGQVESSDEENEVWCMVKTEDLIDILRESYSQLQAVGGNQTSNLSIVTHAFYWVQRILDSDWCQRVNKMKKYCTFKNKTESMLQLINDTYHTMLKLPRPSSDENSTNWYFRTKLVKQFVMKGKAILFPSHHGHHHHGHRHHGQHHHGRGWHGRSKFHNHGHDHDHDHDHDHAHDHGDHHHHDHKHGHDHDHDNGHYGKANFLAGKTMGLHGHDKGKTNNMWGTGRSEKGGNDKWGLHGRGKWRLVKTHKRGNGNAGKKLQDLWRRGNAGKKWDQGNAGKKWDQGNAGKKSHNKWSQRKIVKGNWH